MNDRLDYALLAATPDPLQWGWLGSEFSTCVETEDEFSERAKLRPSTIKSDAIDSSEPARPVTGSPSVIYDYAPH